MIQSFADQLTQVEIAAPVAVLIGVVARIYLGSVLFSPRFTAVWNTLRRVVVPLVDKLRRTRFPNSPSVTNKALEREAVGVVDTTPTTLATQIDTCRYVEIPLLAGYKTDWCDESESGTMVWYYGPTPWPAAPNWLRPYQVHVTTFPRHTDDGLKQLVTAHREANPYRPDKWADHLLKGDSHSADDGVSRTLTALADADVPVDIGHPAITEC